MSEGLEHEGRLAPLVGQECDQVHFSRDTIVIGFSQFDWWLACTGSPVVKQAESLWRFPEPGSRDAICSLINSKAESASVDEDGRADVRFSNGARLTIERGGWRLERWRIKTEAES